MRPIHPLALAVLLASAACSQAPTGVAPSAPASRADLVQRHGRPAAWKLDIADADLVQRTCALYVALRSNAWGPPAFGREVDEAMVQWNTCPGGTMVACTVTPSANGEVVVTGIPLH
jgi:hypothetical protein